MIIGLINNVTLLLSLGIIYEITYYLPEKLVIRYRLIKPLVNGFLTGIIGISIMSVPLKLFPGVVIDARSVLLSVTALVYGGPTVIITSIMMAVFNALVDGMDISAGILIIIFSAGIGLIWRPLLGRISIRYRWLNILLFGLIIQAVMFVCIYLLPGAQPWQTIKDIVIPAFIIYPIGTLLLSLFLLHQIDRNSGLLEVAEAHERFWSIFNNVHTAMLLINPDDGRIIEANTISCSMLGYSNEVLKSMYIHQAIGNIPHEELDSIIQDILKGEKNKFIFTKKTSDDKIYYIEVFSEPVMVRGRITIFSIAYDVSDRIKSQNALAESENRFRMLVENSPDGIFIQTDMKFAYVNKAAISIFGASSSDQLIGTPILDRIHQDFKKKVHDRTLILNNTQSQVPRIDEIYIRLDGTEVPVDVTAVPIYYNGKNGAIIFFRDISERRKMEQANLDLEIQLRQQQKLEAIGTLAGGVAHEINNPINGIMNYADLILDTLDSNSREAGYATEIKHETKRISLIVKNLLQFSRHEKQLMSFANINKIVNDTVSLINTIIKKDRIKFDVIIEPGLPEIKCRSQQVQQVLMNLLTNARDAVNEKYTVNNGKKTIRLMCSQFNNNGQLWVRIIVEDNGGGIPDIIRDKIFEPFFSTKPKEKGTGLGLSISFGIICDHHGIINVDSKEGEYTKFVVDLPVDFPYN